VIPVCRYVLKLPVGFSDYVKSFRYNFQGTQNGWFALGMMETDHDHILVDFTPKSCVRE
jgi:hypothetical protein